MPITYPTSLPTGLRILVSGFDINYHNRAFEAGHHSGNSNVIANAGKSDLFQGVLRTTIQDQNEMLALVAWLTALRGKFGTFLIGDPDRQKPIATTPGNGLVMGASQTGNSLVTDGWGVNDTLILSEGDLVQVGLQVFEMTADITTNGTGEATLVFNPAMRVSPADNATVITTDCKIVARLGKPFADWRTDHLKMGEMEIPFVEDL